LLSSTGQQPVVLKKLKRRPDAKTLVQLESNQTMSISNSQMQVITEAVVRMKLVQVSNQKVLIKALSEARIPQFIWNMAMPNDDVWNKNIPPTEREGAHRNFIQTQKLWRVLLAESGLKMCPKWQEQSFSLLSCIALLQLEKSQESLVKIFTQRVILLERSGIHTAKDFIALLRNAGDLLYQAILQHPQLCNEVFFIGEHTCSRHNSALARRSKGQSKRCNSCGVCV